MLVLCLPQLVLRSPQFDTCVVEFVLEFRLALVVVVQLLTHAVLQLALAAVVLLQALFEGLDLLGGLLQLGLGLVGLTLQVVDVGLLLREDLALVAFELVEVTQDQLIVSLGLLLVLGDLCVALEALLVLGCEFAEFLLEVVELPFQVGLLLLPARLVFLLAPVHFLELVLEVVVGLQLVPQAVLQALDLLGEFVHLLVVFLLQLVGLGPQGV